MQSTIAIASAIAFSLVLSAATIGCKSEPPPPEEPDLDALLDQLDATKQDISEANKKMREAAAARKAKLDGAKTVKAAADAGAKNDPPPAEKAEN